MKTTAALVSLTIAFAAGVMLLQENTDTDAPSDRFTGLGDLAGGRPYSAARGISADGTTVIGQSHATAGMQAFRWTPSGGVMGIGMTDVSAVSGDGSVVVGYRIVGDRTEPVRWTARDGAQSLLAGAGGGTANGVSSDGLMIVGVTDAKTSFELGDRQAAFCWTRQMGMQHLERPNATQIWSEAHAVSADGAVVVGSRRHRTSHNEAFRWTRELGPIGLGVLPGHATSVAYAISADGAVVVGSCSDYLTSEAFRWTKKSGMVSLGRLRDGRHGSTARGVSADGSIVVGSCAGDRGPEAVLWDRAHGVRSIRELLAQEYNLGETLRHWKLRSATAVSADGSTVVGYGLNPDGDQEAWIACIDKKRGNIGARPMIGGQVTVGQLGSANTRH